VSEALEFVRGLWIRAQLEAPPYVQRAVIPRLHEAKEIARLLARPHLPVYQLRGQGYGGPLTVAYVGLDFTKPFMKDLMFADGSVEQEIGRIPFWRCEEIANLSPADVIIVEATKHLVRRLSGRNAIVVPQLVDHILDVRGDWEDVKKRFRKSVRFERRLTKKHGYQYEVSHEDRDFETFYHDMYLPTVESRYGTLASPISAGEAYQYFRRGALFLVKRDGRRVCGSVCYLEQGVVQFIIMGLLNGDEQLMREGAVGALNCLRIQWANQQGYEAVNFLGSGARLRSSLFQYKRKWGTAVSVSPRLHRRIWIKVRRLTPAVSQFLKENPFIVVDRDGKLHGLIVVDDPSDVSTETKEEWEKRYVTPGLSSLVVRSVSSFAEEPVSVSIPDLVIPIPSSSDRENGR
jgi:hypothetical protein